MRCSNANIYKKTKTSNKKLKMSNQRHLPILVFEIELILSQLRQERATKGNKEHFSFPISFICFNSGPAKGDSDINSNEKPEIATTGSEKQQRATKSNEEQLNATKSNEKQKKTDIVGQKTKTGNKKPKQATKGTKSPNGNQALSYCSFVCTGGLFLIID